MTQLSRTHDQPVSAWLEEDGHLHLELRNTLAALATVLDQAEGYCEERGASPALTYRVRLILEELLTNTIKYGYDEADRDARAIRVRVSLGPPLRLHIEDDARPFDPTAQAPPIDPQAPLEARPIGGLGLYMVRQQIAAWSWRREGHRNRLELELPAGLA